MPFTIPTVSDFKAQFARDFPYAVPAWGAGVGITVTGGVISFSGPVLPGQGYSDDPTAAVQDNPPDGSPPATNALVTVNGVANGGVTGFTLVNGGTAYSPGARLIVSGGNGDNSDLTRVTDDDIVGAVFDAAYNVNQCLFGTQEEWNRAFLYLAAHNLVERLLAAGEGMRSRYSWLVELKHAGDLSTKFKIPDNILQSSFLSSLSTTRYGARYLEIISPLLIGNMGTNFRRTPP